jgi:hypothetical protein
MARKFRIAIELSEAEARHLFVLHKELGVKPADTVRKALTMYFSKPIPMGKGARR